MGFSRTWWSMAAAAMVGCGTPPPPAPFQPVADTKQLMISILEPAAEGYWDAVGSVDDASGTTFFAPRSTEEWTRLRDNALLIAESGNLLMMAPRARDGDWMAMARAMIEAGRRALAAAEARDTALVFDAGAEVYDTCARCHATYALQLRKPNERDE
jgi:hypothetical protein